MVNFKPSFLAVNQHELKHEQDQFHCKEHDHKFSRSAKSWQSYENLPRFTQDNAFNLEKVDFDPRYPLELETKLK